MVIKDFKVFKVTKDFRALGEFKALGSQALRVAFKLGDKMLCKFTNI